MSKNFNRKIREYSELEKITNSVRVDLIKMLEEAGSGHSAGPLGMVELLCALYFRIMKHDPKNPNWEERDQFLLSNGHCVPVQYATMAEAGYFPKKELATLRKFGTRLQGHPERSKLPGLENTSGPLGCGLSQALGMGLVNRLQNKRRYTYVVMGDGELNEGNIWEAAMFGAKYKLNNVIAFVDRNNIQIDGPTEIVMPLEDLGAKFESFGWYVIEIDGNNLESIVEAVNLAKAIVDKPSIIILHTIPGKGVSYMEYDYTWHGKPPNHQQAMIALRELRTMGGKIRNEHEK